MSFQQFPNRQAIRDHQLAELQQLLQTVAGRNKFYTPRLRRAGLDGGVHSLEEFFEKMPFTDRQTVVEDQQQHPPYGTNLTYPLEQYTRLHQSSGTGGQPMRWLDTKQSWQWLLDNWKRVFAAAGVGPSDRLYFAFSFGPFLGFWTAFDAAAQMGCLCVPGGGARSLARLEAMRDNRATVLLCTPTYALRLAEVAEQEGVDLGAFEIRKIIVAGEPGGSAPATRADIENRWPTASVFDHHGMTEVGPASYQCPEEPGSLIIIESSYLAEIIDPNTAAPVSPGQVGELVLTTLGRLGSPLMRYRTGDLVRQDDRIARLYGRHEMALQGGVIGRVDDMVVVRGVNIYPSAVDAVVRSFSDVAEYRVEIQSERSMIEMRLQIEPVSDRVDGDDLAARVHAKLRGAFSLRVPVAICPPGTLPRFEMKARRWVRL